LNKSTKFYDNDSKRVLGYLNHPLHKYQKMKRYEHALEMLKLNKNDNVLEIGCGVGYQIPEIAKRCKNYIGIDFSKESLKSCKKIKNVKLIYADAHKLPFKENYFDAALIIDVLENLDNPEKALKEAKRVLKYNGKLVISVPNYYSFYGLTKFILEKIGEWKHKPVPPIDNWYTPLSIISTLKEYSFKIEEIRSSFFFLPFFTGKYYLISSWRVIPRLYNKFEMPLSKIFKYFGYHIILYCINIK
jgi:ubiquinone/menaquinone biosynthesis C-methylase UbiE